MIGIVILNYIKWGDTEKCINSIIENEKNINYQIYIVDNNSPVKITDSLKKMILNYDFITFIENKINSGYNAGNNIGIAKALKDGCEEIVISNSDIVFKKDSIFKMKNYLDNNKQVGIVGPKIYLPDNKIQMINMGTKTGLKEKYMYLLKNTPLKFMVKNFLKQYCALDNKLQVPFKVHSVSGCCFMASKDCIKEITPFDENTFLYHEEIMIGEKMEEKGFFTHYLTSSEVIHEHGQSTEGLKAFAYTCFVQSEIYFLKNYSKQKNYRIFPLYIIRSGKYVHNCLKNKDFRENFSKYIINTTNTFFKKQEA